MQQNALEKSATNDLLGGVDQELLGREGFTAARLHDDYPTVERHSQFGINVNGDRRVPGAVSKLEPIVELSQPASPTDCK